MAILANLRHPNSDEGKSKEQSMTFWESIAATVVLLLKGYPLHTTAANETDGTLQIAIRLLQIGILGGMLHGISMTARGGWRAMLATLVKVPLIPMISLALTFPLLLVVHLSTDGSGTVAQVLTLALIPVATCCVLTAAASPILYYFTLTSDYHFTKLLHFATVLAAGAFGVRSLWAATQAGGAPIASPQVVLPWVLIFGFVSCQVAWSLRPLLGEPSLPYEWLRRRGSPMSFYTALLHSLSALLSRDAAARTSAHAPKTPG
jgi:hypothetical protein